MKSPLQYSCKECGEPLLLKGLKHTAICRSCFAVNDIDPMRKKRYPDGVRRNGQSVLSKILSCGISIASLSVEKMVELITT